MELWLNIVSIIYHPLIYSLEKLEKNVLRIFNRVSKDIGTDIQSFIKWRIHHI